jgi:oxygen-independent coproporphyrinogen-3 oxidase
LHPVPWPPRSAYLHIPFCHRRCFYCDFPVVPLGDRAGAASGQSGAASIAAYLALLQQEIALAPAGPPLSTIYFGGGTPSLLLPAQVGDLLEALAGHFGLAPGAEITLELDPASFDQARLEAYLAAGVNRVSLGGQSFDDAVLASLGRRHRRSDLLAATRWLAQARRQGGLASWSLDLIQAVPGQTTELWREQLRLAIAVGAPHLSVYDLSIEPGTVFAWREQRGELSLPDAELAADLSSRRRSWPPPATATTRCRTMPGLAMPPATTGCTGVAPDGGVSGWVPRRPPAASGRPGRAPARPISTGWSSRGAKRPGFQRRSPIPMHGWKTS